MADNIACSALDSTMLRAKLNTTTTFDPLAIEEAAEASYLPTSRFICVGTCFWISMITFWGNVSSFLVLK